MQQKNQNKYSQDKVSVFGDDDSVEICENEELQKLKKENKKLKKKIKGLKATIKITSQHGDATAENLEQRVLTSEEQYRRVLDAMPVPVLISVRERGTILHVNQRACAIFGFSYEEFLKQTAYDLYVDPEGRGKFLSVLTKDGKANEFESRMKKFNGSHFSVSLSSEPVAFTDESCLLTVIYDLTERERTEAKIRALSELLDKREEKYLIFTLDGEEYGIHITKISEIVGMMPMTSIPEISDYVKGVIYLRDKVIPVVDLRLKLCLETIEYTDRTCIVIVDLEYGKEKKVMGIIVDSVAEVMNIRQKEIESPPDFGASAHTDFISGMAMSEESVKILLDVNKLLKGIA
ncbi:chemotaxis protein CheW [Desulfobacterales bacterium HSG16]|nr:chemotaxis protein CheW [Desulfobacterales bacterium HSG16]